MICASYASESVEESARQRLTEGSPYAFYFRDIDNHENRREVRLKAEGDYVIWKEHVEHTWKMDEDSVFLTLRWQSINGNL